jgi:hypothetical protein
VVAQDRIWLGNFQWMNKNFREIELDYFQKFWFIKNIHNFLLQYLNIHFNFPDLETQKSSWKSSFISLNLFLQKTANFFAAWMEYFTDNLFFSFSDGFEHLCSRFPNFRWNIVWNLIISKARFDIDYLQNHYVPKKTLKNLQTNRPSIQIVIFILIIIM